MIKLYAILLVLVQVLTEASVYAADTGLPGKTTGQSELEQDVSTSSPRSQRRNAVKQLGDKDSPRNAYTLVILGSDLLPAKHLSVPVTEEGPSLSLQGLRTQLDEYKVEVILEVSDKNEAIKFMDANAPSVTKIKPPEGNIFANADMLHAGKAYVDQFYRNLLSHRGDQKNIAIFFHGDNKEVRVILACIGILANTKRMLTKGSSSSDLQTTVEEIVSDYLKLHKKESLPHIKEYLQSIADLSSTLKTAVDVLKSLHIPADNIERAKPNNKICDEQLEKSLDQIFEELTADQIKKMFINVSLKMEIYPKINPKNRSFDLEFLKDHIKFIEWFYWQNLRPHPMNASHGKTQKRQSRTIKLF